MAGKEKHSIDRFVGGSEAERQIADEAMAHRFERQDYEDIRRNERPKTPEERQMVSLVNDEIDRLRERYGLPEFNVPEANFHVVPPSALPSRGERSVGGMFSLRFQAVVVADDPSSAHRLHALFHETLHFKSFGSMSGEKDRERRVGLSVTTGKEMDGEKPAFNALNEAVTEELAKRFMRAQAGSAFLAKEARELQAAREKGLFDEAALEDAMHLFLQDTDDPEKKIVRVRRFPYPKEREALRLLLDKLAARDQKARKEDVFDAFAGAMFNGHLLPLARDIEAAFGKGAFRELGECQDGEQLLTFVESL